MRNEYKALDRFGLICGILSVASLLLGAAGIVLAVYSMKPTALFDGWPIQLLAASIVGGLFWFFAFRALTDAINLLFQVAEKLLIPPR